MAKKISPNIQCKNNMIIFFGTGFFGKVKKQNNQWIETKFFYLMVPIYPINSMLVTSSRWRERQGMEIPLNKTSIIALYGRLVSTAFAVISWINYYIYSTGYYISYGDMHAPRFYFPFFQILFTALAIYFWFFYGKTKKEEFIQRDKIGKSIGVYAMPEWFYTDKAKAILDDLERSYLLDFNSNWKEDLMSEDVPKNRLARLYGLALFNYLYFDDPENLPFYNRAYELFN